MGARKKCGRKGASSGPRVEEPSGTTRRTSCHSRPAIEGDDNCCGRALQSHTDLRSQGICAGSRLEGTLEGPGGGVKHRCLLLGQGAGNQQAEAIACGDTACATGWLPKRGESCQPVPPPPPVPGAMPCFSKSKRSASGNKTFHCWGRIPLHPLPRFVSRSADAMAVAVRRGSSATWNAKVSGSSGRRDLRGRRSGFVRPDHVVSSPGASLAEVRT